MVFSLPILNVLWAYLSSNKKKAIQIFFFFKVKCDNIVSQLYFTKNNKEIFLKLNCVSVLSPHFLPLRNRITNLWMNKSLKKAAWKLQQLIVLQVTVPLFLHNKESPALAVQDDTKKPFAFQTPTYLEATEGACKNSARFRLDVWREPHYLTGT